MKIMNFIRALLPRLEKDRLLEDLRITVGELESLTIPVYSQAADQFKANKMKSAASKDIADIFYRNFDMMGGSKQSSFIADISRRLPYIKENCEYLAELVEDIMERDVISEGLTAKKAIIIRAASSLSFISRYCVDLLNLTLVNEAEEVNADVDEGLTLAPVTIKHVTSHLPTFAKIVSAYGIPRKDFEKILTKVPDVIVNTKTAPSLSSIYKEHELDPFGSNYVVGFTANPIYHIRLLVAEWQAGRFKANKDKKKMLELRMLHLKMLQEKKNDPKIEQEIVYIQSRVDKIDRYLREVEDSLKQGD